MAKALMAGQNFAGKTFTAPEESCRLFTALVLPHLASDSAIRVLDIGCGTGGQIFNMAKALPKASFTGVDVSEANIAIARSFSQNERIRFVVADYLDWAAEPFDLIISRSTLHLIEAPTEKLLSKISRDLVPGGLLAFTMPYGCLYNHFLWIVRRLFRAVRSPFTDRLLYVAGKRLHGRWMSEEMLRERVHYMYLLPQRYGGRAFDELLQRHYGLRLLSRCEIPHAGPGQPKHRFYIFQKHLAR
jgi:trans-aconitate methyltransferase